MYNMHKWLWYKFRDESQPELIEFFKAVAQQKRPEPSQQLKLWEKVLPINEGIEAQITSFSSEPLVQTIIDITEDDDESIVKQVSVTETHSIADDFFVVEEDSSQLVGNETQVNLIVKHLIQGVRELLESESILSEDIIKQFVDDVSPQRLEDVFTSLGNTLNSESILKLWKSIVSANCIKYNIVANCFLQYILMEKLCIYEDPSLKLLLLEIFKDYPEELTTTLQKKICNTNKDDNLKIFRNNLSSLPNDHKNTVLRIFVKNCTKFEAEHIETICNLITSDGEPEDLIKLLKLMSIVAKEFTNSKAYGKLLLEVVQTLGPNAFQIEQEFQFIMSFHKSIYKNQIMNVYRKCLLDRELLSQSFRL